MKKSFILLRPHFENVNEKRADKTPEFFENIEAEQIEEVKEASSMSIEFRSANP